MSSKPTPPPKQNATSTDCTACNSLFTDPRQLPCSHTFCLKCVVDCAKDKKLVACPRCNEEFTVPAAGVAALPKNVLMQSLVDRKMKRAAAAAGTPAAAAAAKSVSKGVPCDVCGEDGKTATMRCVQCEQNYCQHCTEGHSKVKATASHKLVHAKTSANDDLSDDGSSTPTVVHVIRKGANIRGLAILGDELFVAREGSRVLDVYKLDSFKFHRQRVINIDGRPRTCSMDHNYGPGRNVNPTSLAAWADQSYLFMAESERNVIVRFTPYDGYNEEKTFLMWPVDCPNIARLSITAEGRILVVGRGDRILEYMMDGYFAREIRLDTRGLHHAIHLTEDIYLTSSNSDVQIVRNDGEKLASFKDQPDAGVQLDTPRGLAAFEDRKRFIVADVDTKKIVVMNGDLTKGRELDLKVDGDLNEPLQLLVDEQRDLLYITERRDGRVIIVGGINGFKVDAE